MPASTQCVGRDWATLKRRGGGNAPVTWRKVKAGKAPLTANTAKVRRVLQTMAYEVIET